MERWISIVKIVPAGEARKALPSALQIDQWELTACPLPSPFFWQLQAVSSAFPCNPHPSPNSLTMNSKLHHY